MAQRAHRKSETLAIAAAPPAAVDTAAAAAFAPGGPFAAMEGPALLLDVSGVVLANGGGRQLAADRMALALTMDAAETTIRSRIADRTVVPADMAVGRRLIECDVAPWGGHALVIGRDVTMERGVREALELSRERYRTLLNLAADCVWETDVAGRLEMLAPNDIFGAAAANLIGQPLERLLVSESPGLYSGAAPGEWAAAGLNTADGAVILGAAVTAPIQDAETGKTLGLRGCFRRSRPLRGEAPGGPPAGPPISSD